MDSPLISRFAPSKFDERHTAPALNPSRSSNSILASASASAVVLFLYIFLAMSVYLSNPEGYSGIKTYPAVDALYYSIIMLCRIGYGDIIPLTPVTKTLSCIFVLVSFGIIRMLLTRAVSHLLDLEKRFMCSRFRIGHYLFDLQKGCMHTCLKATFALGAMVICFGTGTLAFYYLEELDLINSFYLSVISVTTIGYGNRAFKTLLGRLFASFWLLVSTFAVATIFLFLIEATIGKRRWKIVKNATTINHNGSMSKSEFMIAKLKKMGRISEEDILKIYKQLEKLNQCCQRSSGRSSHVPSETGATGPFCRDIVHQPSEHPVASRIS